MTNTIKITSVKATSLRSVFDGACSCLKNSITNKVIVKCDFCKKKEQKKN